MRAPKLRRHLVAASLALPGLAWRQSGAAGWPARPVRLIVPFPPGGGTDAVARLMGQRLSDGLLPVRWTPSLA